MVYVCALIMRPIWFTGEDSYTLIVKGEILYSQVSEDQTNVYNVVKKDIKIGKINLIYVDIASAEEDEFSILELLDHHTSTAMRAVFQ